MEKFHNIVYFKPLTYNYRKTVLPEEHLKTLSSFRNHFVPEYVKKIKLN